MSSAVSIFPKTPIPLSEWKLFCEVEGIEHSPQVVGGNVYYYGGMHGVEIVFEPERIQVGTYFMGPALKDVALIAKKILARFPGSHEADEEIEPMMGQKSESLSNLAISSIPIGIAGVLGIASYLKSRNQPQ